MARTVEVIRDYLVANTSVVAFDNLADVREEGFWEGREIFSQIMNFMAILAFMILFVSLFLIANTMNTIVSEQTREIAMMKAIGATRGTVFRSFLTTSALIGFIGAGIGAGLGILVASLVERTFMKQSFGFDAAFDVHWPTVGISLAVGVGVVVLASLPAIFRTLRVSVVEGLESHGISADYGRTFLDRSLMRIRGIPRVVQMGIRNAARRKGRSISTILQVAFAVAVVITMLNGGDGLIDMTVRAYDVRTWDLWTTVADNPSDPMTVDKAALIEGIDGVKSAEPVNRTVAQINDRTVPFYGYVQDTQALDFDTTLLENGQGRWWTPEEATAAERVVVIGDALSRFENIELGDTIELMTATGAHEFEVIGIDTAFTENGQFVYAPLETVQAVLQKGDAVNGFFIQTDSRDHQEIDATSRRVSDELEALGYRADVTVNYVAAAQNVAQNADARQHVPDGELHRGAHRAHRAHEHARDEHPGPHHGDRDAPVHRSPVEGRAARLLVGRTLPGVPGVGRGPSAGLCRVPDHGRRDGNRDEAHAARQVRPDLRRLVARLRDGRHADRDLLPSPTRHQHEARRRDQVRIGVARVRTCRKRFRPAKVRRTRPLSRARFERII